METSTRGHKIALFLACVAGPAQVGAAACSSAKPPATQVRPTAEASSEPEAETLPPLHVLQRLRGSEAERRACFQVSGEALHGFVKLAWEVTSEGRVDEVLIEGTSVHNQQVEQCLAQAVKAMDFGPRPQASKARWTFVHRLPKMPGVDEAIEAKRKKKKKKKREEQEVTGVSIEEASPGSLDLQRIEDIVHAGFPLFAYCYRSGIERDPTLSGLVHLRFVIDEEGAVMGVMDSGSEFRDKSALDCMAEGIFALNFPPPQGGDVRVQYRIVFESG